MRMRHISVRLSRFSPQNLFNPCVWFHTTRRAHVVDDGRIGISGMSLSLICTWGTRAWDYIWVCRKASRNSSLCSYNSLSQSYFVIFRYIWNHFCRRHVLRDNSPLYQIFLDNLQNLYNPLTSLKPASTADTAADVSMRRDDGSAPALIGRSIASCSIQLCDWRDIQRR